MKYIHVYDSVSAFTADYESEAYLEPWVSYTDENEQVNYNKEKSEWEKMREVPFTIQIPDVLTPVYSTYPITKDINLYVIDTTQNYFGPYPTNDEYIQYKINDGQWETGLTLSGALVHAGDIIQLRSTTAKTSGSWSFAIGHKNGNTSNVNSRPSGLTFYGNVMSLIDADNFSTASAPNVSRFQHLFGVLDIVDASLVYLPTTLGTNCYQNMFQDCRILEIPPQLPATTLASFCYAGMFSNCINLTTAPVLPADTLAARSYISMFNGCTSLSQVKCLATDISAAGSTTYWMNGVAASGTFIKPASMTGWSSGADGIPNGWTVEDA